MTMGLRMAHLTDLHLTDGPRLADQAEVLEAVVQTAVGLGVQATLLTGDVYGRTVPHRSTPRERAVLYPAVRALARLGPVVVVPGNHDYPGDLDTLAAIGGGLDWPVVVLSRPRVLRLATPGAPLHVYGVPWPTKRNLLADDSTPRVAEAARQVASAKLDQLLGLWAQRVQRARRREPGGVHVVAAHCMTRGARTSGGEVLTGYEIELSRQGLECMGVDYGALGHVHMRQEVAARCWYGGDPWPVDFGETDPKGWSVVDVALEGTTAANVLDDRRYPSRADGAHATRVQWVQAPARRWLTLDWRWAADHDSGTPRWVTAPKPQQLEEVRGAEVRARLVVGQPWVAGCPWEEVLADLHARGAHRVTAERVIEPVHRVRAPEVATATTPRDKLVAWWGTLETPPDPADRATTMAILAELTTHDDDQIRADTDRLLTAPEPRP